MNHLREGLDDLGRRWIEFGTIPVYFAGFVALGAVGLAVDFTQGPKIAPDHWMFIAPVFAMAGVAFLWELWQARESRLRVTLDEGRSRLDVQSRKKRFGIDLAELDDVVVETRITATPSNPYPRYHRIAFVLRGGKRIAATDDHYTYTESGAEKFVHRLGQMVGEIKR